MSILQEIIETLKETSRHPNKAVKKAMEQTGKEAVGCFPIYTPEEMIYAAGMLPVGLWGGQTEIKLADRYLQSFCCSIMRSNVELGMKGVYDFLSAVIIPTYCDTLKCICENWKAAAPQTYLIPMVYPQNRKIKAGVSYLKDEFTRVKEEIEKIANRPITERDLEKSWRVYEDYRKAMRLFTEVAKKYPITINATTRHLIIKAAYFMDKQPYTEMIYTLIEELKKQKPEETNGAKVVVTGILAEPEMLLDTFVENDISFCADDLAHESRQFRTFSREEGTIMDKLVNRTTDMQGCSLLYDDSKTRGQMLIDMVKENGADGIVICMLKFCDPEEFDYPIYKKELEAAGIPMLYLEIEQNMKSVEQLRTRIQSFAEIITS